MQTVRRFFSWVWATYETLTLLQWLAAISIGTAGIAPMPIIGFINEWPLWMQAVLSGAAALAWLILLTWFLSFSSRRKKEAGEATPSASAHDSGAASVAIGAAGVSQAISGSHNVVAGRDIHIHVPPGAILVAKEPTGATSLQPIPPSTPLYVTCNYRKTAGAVGGVCIGLKLNGVVLTEVQRVTSTLNQAEEGFATWEVGGASAGGNRTAIMRWATKDAQGQIGGTANGLGGAITEATITGKVDDARITLGVSQLNVYALPS